MKNIRHLSTGFTLTELMVVVLIMGILATLAVPSYQSFMRTQRAKEASIALYTSLVLARSEAIKRGLEVELVPTDADHWHKGWKVLVLGFDDPLKTQVALDSVQINLDFGEDNVVFQKNGRIVPPGSGTNVPKFQVDVDTTQTDYVRCVRVTLSGVPKSLQGVCP